MRYRLRRRKKSDARHADTMATFKSAPVAEAKSFQTRKSDEPSSTQDGGIAPEAVTEKTLDWRWGAILKPRRRSRGRMGSTVCQGAQCRAPCMRPHWRSQALHAGRIMNGDHKIISPPFHQIGNRRTGVCAGWNLDGVFAARKAIANIAARDIGTRTGIPAQRNTLQSLRRPWQHGQDSKGQLHKISCGSHEWSGIFWCNLFSALKPPPAVDHHSSKKTSGSKQVKTINSTTGRSVAPDCLLTHMEPTNH